MTLAECVGQVSDGDAAAWLARWLAPAEFIAATDRQAKVLELAEAIIPERHTLTRPEIDALCAWVVALRDGATARGGDSDFLAITDRPAAPAGTSAPRWNHVCRRVLARLAAESIQPPAEVEAAIRASVAHAQQQNNREEDSDAVAKNLE
jgi:hypothetical protein